MARITTGYSFGITRREALICAELYKGKSTREIAKIHFNCRDANGNIDESKVTAAVRKIRHMMHKKGFEECYNAMARETLFEGYGQAQRKINDQINDPNPWLANKAANDTLNRYDKVILGSANNEVVVRVEGMPNIGTPDDVNPVITAPDDINDPDDDDVDIGGE